MGIDIEGGASVGGAGWVVSAAGRWGGLEARFDIWNGFEPAGEEKGFWFIEDEVENRLEGPDAENRLELKMALPRFSGGRSRFVSSLPVSRATFSFAGLEMVLEILTPRIALILPSFF